MGFKLKKELLSIGFLTFIFTGLYAILPSANANVYASPDETANAVEAMQIATHWRVYLPEEPLAVVYPWLHPRSWVSVGAKIAPVGFLGWPFVLAFVFLIFGKYALLWGGALVVLSAIWPFWRLLCPFGRTAAWFGVLVAFTFPTMILYANRGLFANAVVVAGCIWGIWLLRWLAERPRALRWYTVIAFVLALTIAIRPLEIFWILPWWIWAGHALRPTKRQCWFVAVTICLAIVPIFWLAQQAYGSWIGVGYLMKDNPYPESSFLEVSSLDVTSVAVWPFGIHPRQLLSNVRDYLFGLVWPWSMLLIVVILLRLRDLRRNSFRWQEDFSWIIGIWTVGILLLYYGSGVYRDNINAGAITICNSFLRYLLPIAPLAGLATAWVWNRFSFLRTFRVVAGSWFVLLAVFGIFRALFADQEGVIPTRRELLRYMQIRQAAHQWFKPGDLILSERSDKVFFPDFRAAVAWRPQDLFSLATAPVADNRIGIGLFARPLSQESKDVYFKLGFSVNEVATFGRENLYRLEPINP